MAREQAELQDTLRNDLNRRRRLEQVETRMHDKLKDDHVDVAATKELELELAKAELGQNAANHRTEATSRMLHGDIEREKSLARSLSRNIEHLRQQREINKKLKTLRDKKDKELADNQDRLRYLEMMRNEGDARRAKMLENRNLEESGRRIRESERRMDDHIHHLREQHDQQRQAHADDHLNDSSRMTAVSNGLCLDDVTDSAAESSQWSLDRRRGNLDEEERHLMEEVRNLRQRLVANRAKSFNREISTCVSLH